MFFALGMPLKLLKDARCNKIIVMVSRGNFTSEKNITLREKKKNLIRNMNQLRLATFQNEMHFLHWGMERMTQARPIPSRCMNYANIRRKLFAYAIGLTSG
uniref:Uncharacterized protein n=1 Tax=Rhizophora mucronata TaxID=61149 RepID=A0A2P2KHV6_RHIMU